ncbi:MAG: hypothetical protein RIG82_02730 [Phycisphaeraceae bacterium]
MRPINPLLLALTLLLTGCDTVGLSSLGTLTITSRADERVQLTASIDRAIYSLDGKQALTAILLSGSAEAPQRAIVLRVFWSPRAGATPVSRSATNTSIEVMVFADRVDQDLREVGLYAGAGYVYLNDKPGDRLVGAEVWEADLILTDQSLGFRDRLGRSNLTGRLQLRRDDAGVQTILASLRAQASGALEYPRLVSATPASRSF